MSQNYCLKLTQLRQRHHNSTKNKSALAKKSKSRLAYINTISKQMLESQISQIQFINSEEKIIKFENLTNLLSQCQDQIQLSEQCFESLLLALNSNQNIWGFFQKLCSKLKQHQLAYLVNQNILIQIYKKLNSDTPNLQQFPLLMKIIGHFSQFLSLIPIKHFLKKSLQLSLKYPKSLISCFCFMLQRIVKYQYNSKQVLQFISSNIHRIVSILSEKDVNISYICEAFAYILKIQNLEIIYGLFLNSFLQKLIKVLRKTNKIQDTTSIVYVMNTLMSISTKPQFLCLTSHITAKLRQLMVVMMKLMNNTENHYNLKIQLLCFLRTVISFSLYRRFIYQNDIFTQILKLLELQFRCYLTDSQNQTQTQDSLDRSLRSKVIEQYFALIRAYFRNFDQDQLQKSMYLYNFSISLQGFLQSCQGISLCVLNVCIQIMDRLSILSKQFSEYAKMIVELPVFERVDNEYLKYKMGRIVEKIEKL